MCSVATAVFLAYQSWKRWASLTWATWKASKRVLWPICLHYDTSKHAAIDISVRFIHMLLRIRTLNCNRPLNGHRFKVYVNLFDRLLFILLYMVFNFFISQLILYNNNLTVISESLVEKWEELDEIDLRFNPWTCACENNWIAAKLIPIMKEKSKDHPNMYEDIKWVEFELAVAAFLVWLEIIWCLFSGVIIRTKWMVDRFTKSVQNMRQWDAKTTTVIDQSVMVPSLWAFSSVSKAKHPMFSFEYNFLCFQNTKTKSFCSLSIRFRLFHLGLMIGIPLTMAGLFIYRRGCLGIFGYRPNPADYGRAFYKRTELREGLHI